MVVNAAQQDRCFRWVLHHLGSEPVWCRMLDMRPGLIPQSSGQVCCTPLATSDDGGVVAVRGRVPIVDASGANLSVGESLLPVVVGRTVQQRRIGESLPFLQSRTHAAAWNRKLT